MKTLTMNDKNTLCRKLAGFEKREIICSESLRDGEKKQLTLVFRFAGYFDTLLEFKSYWVQWGDKTQTFTEINNALEFYAYLR